MLSEEAEYGGIIPARDWELQVLRSHMRTSRMRFWRSTFRPMYRSEMYVMVTKCIPKTKVSIFFL